MRSINAAIARRLEEAADLLEQQRADLFRVRAYRRAADSVRHSPQPLDNILRQQGLGGLERLPAVGPTISRAIRELIVRGRLPMIDRLRGIADPEVLLASVPGIGRRLAQRLHAELSIETLEQLETAAHDGRLRSITGFGAKRLAGIEDTLAQRLGRVRSHRPMRTLPPVADLLDVDREYRERAGRGELPIIAPLRFNPGGEAWLPVLHTQRAGRGYTAMFSNTARAHRLGKTHDWVVIYVDHDGGDYQATVITAERGPRRGERIVAGRDRYEESTTAVPSIEEVLRWHST